MKDLIVNDTEKINTKQIAKMNLKREEQQLSLYSLGVAVSFLFVFHTMSMRENFKFNSNPNLFSVFSREK